MVKSENLLIRMTTYQRERIRNNAESKGYKTLSSYMRAMALDHDSNIHRKIDEIHKKLIESEELK